MKILINIVCLLCVLSACNNAAINEADIPEKEKELKTVIEQHPDSMLLKENLIQYYCDNNNFGSAIKVVDQFIEKDTANARLWDIKASLHFQNKDTINTIKAFERAIEIFPDPQYIISLGAVYAQTKNPSALAVADGLIQMPNANAQLQAIYIKGLYYNYSGDHAKAIPFFDNCIKMDYTFLDAYIEKTIAHFEMGNYTEALNTAQKVVQVDHSFADGYYWMGRSCEKLNKKTEAAESYKAALNLDPDYVEAKDALGKLGVL